MHSAKYRSSRPTQISALRLAVLAGLSIFGAQALASDQTYIEAMGASISVTSPLAQAQSSGKDSNPLLQPDASTKQASNSFKTEPLSVASNVPRLNNVPSYADKPPAAAPQVSNSEIAAGANVPRAGGAANAVLANEALPSPKIDFKDEVLTKVAPMDTEMLRSVIQELYNRQAGAVTPANPGMVCRSTQYAVDLSPGATPPVVRVAKGVGAIVNFVDSAGNPWPITFARNFHQEAAIVTQMAPHIISAAASSNHLSGSVGVVLEGLTTPVTFIVTPGQEETDCRVDLRVTGLAPGAVAAPGQITNRPGIAADGLMGFMYGQTPEGAKRLTLTMPGNENNTTRAWQDADGRLVLRTPASVVSPGWYQSMAALDGTTVYQMPPTSVINVSVQGEPRKILISGLVPMSSKKAGDLLSAK